MSTAVSKKPAAAKVEVAEPSQEMIVRLSKDLANAAKSMSKDEARFLVDAYYIIQEDRKRSGNQVRALEKSQEPHALLIWFRDNNEILEGQIRRALDIYSNSQPLGRWARSIYGIGPVIAAGLLAHIDLDIARHVADIWRYAGLDPTSKWEKGKKRPWNAELKVLCWKTGESFMKQSGDDECYYGKILLQRWSMEKARNKAGHNVVAAAYILANKNIGKDTDAYLWYSGSLKAEVLNGWDELTLEAKKKQMEKCRVSPGQGLAMLPPAHILARAKRYSVKWFLGDYFTVGYTLDGKETPIPYPVAKLNHETIIAPHNMAFVRELIEEKKAA
jgi:hypothetical protein